MPSAQLTIQTLFVLLKHGFVTMSRTVRYAFLNTPLLDVAIFIHNSIRYHTLVSGPANLELFVVSLSRNNFKLCLGVFIDPPHPQILFLTFFVANTLFSIDQSHFSNFVIVGDFNVNFDSSHAYTIPDNIILFMHSDWYYSCNWNL